MGKQPKLIPLIKKLTFRKAKQNYKNVNEWIVNEGWTVRNTDRMWISFERNVDNENVEENKSN